jgi:hypothetical protein
MASDRARDATGHVPAASSKTRSQVPARPARRGPSNGRKYGRAPSIAACVSAATDIRAASASRSLRPKPPCRNGSAICVTGARSAPSPAPKSPSTAGGKCSQERAAACTADSRRRTPGSARSHSTVRRTCAKRGGSDWRSSRNCDCTGKGSARRASTSLHVASARDAACCTSKVHEPTGVPAATMPSGLCTTPRSPASAKPAAAAVLPVRAHLSRAISRPTTAASSQKTSSAPPARTLEEGVVSDGEHADGGHLPLACFPASRAVPARRAAARAGRPVACQTTQTPAASRRVR